MCDYTRIDRFFVFAERKKNMKPKSKSNRIRDVPEIKNIVEMRRLISQN